MFELKTDGRRSSSGEQFFLLKEGEVLIFATHTNMHPLAEATTIYVDGMFNICSISERASCNRSHNAIVGGSLRQVGYVHVAKRRKVVQWEEKIIMLQRELTTGERILNIKSAIRHCVVAFDF